MHNDIQPPAYTRHTDPKGKVAKAAAAIAPYVSLIAVLSLAGNIILGLVVWMGGRMISPKEEIAALKVEIAALKVEDKMSREQRDRVEIWSLALIRSKCLELDPGTQAVSVLPCDEVRQRLRWKAPELEANQSPYSPQSFGPRSNRIPDSEMIIMSSIPLVPGQDSPSTIVPNRSPTKALPSRIVTLAGLLSALSY